MPELYDDLLTLEVELDDELTGMFRMTLALLCGPTAPGPTSMTTGSRPGSRKVVTRASATTPPSCCPAT